jgi:hypothetical protein
MSSATNCEQLPRCSLLERRDATSPARGAFLLASCLPGQHNTNTRAVDWLASQASQGAVGLDSQSLDSI